MATIPSAFGGTASGVSGPGPVTLSGAYSATPALSVTDSTATPTVPPAQLTAAAAADLVLGVQVTADSVERFTINSNGLLGWSSGGAAQDIRLARGGAGHQLQLQIADLDVSTIGRGLQVAEGTNAKQGTAVLVAGTVTVANTAVTANSRIFLTGQLLGGTAGGLNVTSRVAGTSFTITSTNAADTSTVAYQIFEPG